MYVGPPSALLSIFPIGDGASSSAASSATWPSGPTSRFYNSRVGSAALVLLDLTSPRRRAGLSSARVILMGGGREPHTHCGARRRLQLGFLLKWASCPARSDFLMGFVPGAQRAIFLLNLRGPP